jgi:hypothetical protein
MVRGHQEEEDPMKTRLRLTIFGLVGLMTLFLFARFGLTARLMGAGSSLEQAAQERIGEEPVFFSEWLFGDLCNISAMPLVLESIGGNSETFSAYVDLHSAHEKTKELWEEEKMIKEHLAAKSETLERFCAGKISLIAAAEEFIAADQRYGHGRVEHILAAYAGRTQLEKYCNRVVLEVENSSPLEPKAHRDILTRAQADLRYVHDNASSFAP